MTKIRLEIDSVEIHRPKRRWNLYFIVAANHPTDPDKSVVSILPDGVLSVIPRDNNKIYFDSINNGKDGLLLLTQTLPVNRELNVDIWIMHSRRNGILNDVLKEIETGITNQSNGVLQNIMGTNRSWLVISRQQSLSIRDGIAKIPDRTLGHICLRERLAPEFDSEIETDCLVREGDVTCVFGISVEG